MMSLEAELERLAVAELERANKKFPLFASDHEGYAVILEEFQESEEEVNRARFRLNRLWESVRADEAQTEYIRHIRERMLKAAVKALQDNAVEFELFGICSDYVPLDTAIQVVIKLGKG